MSSISPLLLPVSYISRIDAAESVSWSVSATISASGQLQGSEAIAFSESGGAGSGSIQASTSINFSASGVLVGQSYAISPSLLPISIYNFESSVSASGSLSVDFSATATAQAVGSIAGIATLAIGDSGTISQFARFEGATSLAFSESVNLRGRFGLSASESIEIAATGRLKTLAASGTIAFSESVTPSATGSLAASTSLNFVSASSLTTVEQLSVNHAILPIVLPGRKYTFAQSSPSQFGTTSISFSTDARLTAVGSVNPDAIRGSTSIADIFDVYTWLEGTGALAGAATIAFAETGDVNYGKITATASISVGDSGTIAAIGTLQAAESIAFSESGNLIVALKGSTSIAVGDSGTIAGRGKLSGLSVVRFLNAGQLIRPVFGSTSIGFTAVGGIRRFVGTVDVLPNNVIPIANEYPKSSQSHVIKVNRGAKLTARGTTKHVRRSVIRVK